VPSTKNAAISFDYANGLMAFFEKSLEVAPFSLRRLRVPAVFCDGPPDALDAGRCVRASAQPTMKPAASVRHRGTLAGATVPILCTASRGFREIS
jgi:hypothetical protein